MLSQLTDFSTFLHKKNSGFLISYLDVSYILSILCWFISQFMISFKINVCVEYSFYDFLYPVIVSFVLDSPLRINICL